MPEFASLGDIRGIFGGYLGDIWGDIWGKFEGSLEEFWRKFRGNFVPGVGLEKFFKGFGCILKGSGVAKARKNVIFIGFLDFHDFLHFREPGSGSQFF